MAAKICSLAAEGSASHWSPGPPAAEISANEIGLTPWNVARPCRFHGQWMPADWTQKPTKAAIATRPCLISAWRNQPISSGEPAVPMLSGSQ